MHQVCHDESRSSSSADFLPWRDDFDEEETAEIKLLFVLILVGSGSFGWPCWSIGSRSITKLSNTFKEDKLPQLLVGQIKDHNGMADCWPHDKNMDFISWHDAFNESLKELLLGAGTFGNTVAKYPLL